MELRTYTKMAQVTLHQGKATLVLIVRAVFNDIIGIVMPH